MRGRRQLESASLADDTVVSAVRRSRRASPTKGHPVIPTSDSVYDLVVDTRWTHGAFTWTNKEGTSGEFEMPFIGWATRVRWTAPQGFANNRDDVATTETTIVPVFLSNSGYPVAPFQVDTEAGGDTDVSLEGLLSRASGGAVAVSTTPA